MLSFLAALFQGASVGLALAALARGAESGLLAIAAVLAALAFVAAAAFERDRDHAEPGDALVGAFPLRPLALAGCLAAALPFLPPYLALVAGIGFGAAAGRAFRVLALFAAVPGTQRIHLMVAWVGAAALAAAPWPWRDPFHARVAQAAAGALLIALAALAARRAGVMTVPLREPLTAGPFTSLGALLVGVGMASASPHVALRDSAAAFALGALALWTCNRDLRRPGLATGCAALAAVAILAGRVRFAAALAPAPWLDRAVLALPACLFGFALPALPRLYAGQMIARKIIRRAPEEERRAQDGGALRSALVVLGFVLGSAVLPALPAGLVPPLLLLAAGGLLIGAFDPRAGSGRKAMHLGVLGAAAAVGIAAIL